LFFVVATLILRHTFTPALTPKVPMQMVIASVVVLVVNSIELLGGVVGFPYIGRSFQFVWIYWLMQLGCTFFAFDSGFVEKRS
jgi:hypothetical protein